jgi:hypothetical protein
MERDYYKQSIQKGLSEKATHTTIARKIYLSYPTFSFSDHPEQEFSVKNEIANKFEVDIFSIHFGGSAQTGESYHKDSVFVPGKSDLDAAIISPSLFLRYLELTCEITDNFSDMTKFTGSTQDTYRFKKYLTRGIFVPELMPHSPAKIDWNSFFNNLSQGNLELFDNINCWIYSTQKIFELKFSKTIQLLEKK